MIEDLRWFGFEWQEGRTAAGRSRPTIKASGWMSIAPRWESSWPAISFIPAPVRAKTSRRNARAACERRCGANYPGTCRQNRKSEIGNRKFAWRFRVPDGETVSFVDGNCGEQRFVAGKDFGDFVVWRGDGVPAYQLACVADDAAMQITEVVRGADLLVSTARQILLYRALGLTPPAFFHCRSGSMKPAWRLAKRHDALSLRTLRDRGETPESLRQKQF